MALIIPVHAIPAQVFNIVLDDLYCSIKLYQRGKRLYMDLETAEDTIFTGALCQHGAKVNQSPHPVFTGSLHFYDSEGQHAPRYEGLNSRWYLIYLSQGEAVPYALRS